MSVFTIVHRALPPLPLPWKRRTSPSLKGKAPALEITLNEKSPHIPESESNSPGPGPHAENNDNQDTHSRPMHRDVHSAAQVAVKSDAREHPITHQPPTSIPERTPVPASDSSSERRASCSEHARRARDQLARAVSWTSIVRSECRWTAEQERELLRAQRQLGRCQKAWSSEQEVWLSYVQALNEEKEAHAGFLSMRHRQQDEEQHQFRKAWKRRRSSSGDDEMQQSAIETVHRSGKLRRLPRYGYSGQRLGTMGPAVVTVEG